MNEYLAVSRKMNGKTELLLVYATDDGLRDLIFFPLCHV